MPVILYFLQLNFQVYFKNKPIFINYITHFLNCKLNIFYIVTFLSFKTQIKQFSIYFYFFTFYNIKILTFWISCCIIILKTKENNLPFLKLERNDYL